jgi:hypothetical protein
MEFPMYPVEDDRREQATADARHLRTVKILDAWLARAGNYALEMHRHRGEYWLSKDDAQGLHDLPMFATPALARIAAADALAAEDPSLLEGL